MQKRRKYIALVLVFNILLYSSGQAFMVNSCECHDDDTIEMNSTYSFSPENVVLNKEIQECCSKDFSDIVKIASPINHSSSDCSVSCSLRESIDIELPILFFNTTLTFEKNEIIEATYNFAFDISNNLNIENKRTNFDHNIFPISFGKNLLIKLHTLKIPTSYS
ncbi:MAG: hypothetical protein PF445_12805 [Melioribacteraceae bacterium]|jgi:hypothetical protein|nr:hypothetical protein [Melioribacteraceae bacterium]